MRSPESASSALLKVAIGLPRASAMYVLPHTLTSLHLSIRSLAHPRPRNSYSTTKSGSPLRARTARKLGRLHVLVQVANPVDPTASCLFQSDGQPPRDWDPYVKQTYSVYLNESDGNKRKWHLSTYSSSPFSSPCLIFLAAYFTQATVDSLGTVDDIPVLKDLVVPEGLFRSSRRTKTRSSRANGAAHAADASPAAPAPASSSGKSGKQIASVAGPSSTVTRTPPQVMTQSAAPQQNQALPPTSPYPHELFDTKSPPYSGLPTNSAPPPPPPPPVQQPDAYARLYTGESYASPQPPEGYHVSPSPHMQPHVTPFEYNWPAPPTPVTDNACPPGYPYPVVVDSQKGDSAFQHSPVQSQLYVYEPGFQASLQYRTVSPALSHAPSQFSASSQSQSSSESDSPAPGPVPLRTPVFSPDRLSVVLPTDGETKYEIHGIRESADGTIDSKMGLASLESLNRYHPYRREPLDDRVVQRFLRPF